MGYAGLVGVILPFFQLLPVLLVVHPVQLSHFLYFVQVHHETLLIRVVLFDALSTEDGQVIRAIEMLNSLVVLVAEEALDAILIFEVQVS